MSQKEMKKILLPLEKEDWKAFRHVALDKEISMNELLRDAIKKIIKKHQKKVDGDE